jgi:hypothetical protein
MYPGLSSVRFLGGQAGCVVVIMTLIITFALLVGFPLAFQGSSCHFQRLSG